LDILGILSNMSVLVCSSWMGNLPDTCCCWTCFGACTWVCLLVGNVYMLMAWWLVCVHAFNISAGLSRSRRLDYVVTTPTLGQDLFHLWVPSCPGRICVSIWTINVQLLV
jgi:hypothetical protein